MRIVITVVIAAGFLSAAAPPPPRALPPPLSPACKPTDSADYVPGVDVHGKPVTPADLPGGPDIVVSTTVYPRIKTGNPNAPSVTVPVQLPGLGQPQNCAMPPAPQKLTR